MILVDRLQRRSVRVGLAVILRENAHADAADGTLARVEPQAGSDQALTSGVLKITDNCVRMARVRSSIWSRDRVVGLRRSAVDRHRSTARDRARTRRAPGTVRSAAQGATASSAEHAASPAHAGQPSADVSSAPP